MARIIDLDDWLDTDDTCKRLAISRMTLWRMAAAGRIRFEMVGRTPLYYCGDAASMGDDHTYSDDTSQDTDNWQ